MLQSPSLVILKNGLDSFLSNMIQVDPALEGGWTRCPAVVPLNFIHSTIVWFLWVVFQSLSPLFSSHCPRNSLENFVLDDSPAPAAFPCSHSPCLGKDVSRTLFLHLFTGTILSPPELICPQSVLGGTTPPWEALSRKVPLILVQCQSSGHLRHLTFEIKHITRNITKTSNYLYQLVLYFQLWA